MVLTVVFPCVPATAIVRRSRVIMPSTSLRFRMRAPLSSQYFNKGEETGTAGVRTTST